MKLDEVKMGEKDARGRLVYSILWSTKDYVIFSHQHGVSPHFSDEEELAIEQRKRYARIGDELEGVNFLRSCMSGKTESIDRGIARAISIALDGGTDRAIQILGSVKKRLERLISIEGRLYYQLTCLATMILVAIVAGITVLVGEDSNSDKLNLVLLLQICACGALGGFLSVSLGIKKIEIEPDTSWYSNVLAGASRIMIAMIASIFVYFAIKSGLILSALEFNDSKYAIFAIAIASGFSEAFVPNVLRGLTSDNVKHEE